VVGVNKFVDSAEELVIPAPDYSMLEMGQVKSLAHLRSSRNAAAVAANLATLKEAARSMAEGDPGNVQMMPHIIDAVRARCTLGEISTAFLEVWGAHSPSV